MANINKENRPYIRLSEILEKHKIFTFETEPFDADGEGGPATKNSMNAGKAKKGRM